MIQLVLEFLILRQANTIRDKSGGVCETQSADATRWMLAVYPTNQKAPRVSVEGDGLGWD